MLEVLRARTADPFFAKRGVPNRVPEGGQALIEDFVAVRDEQQPCSWQFGAQPGVVDCGHDGFAGAGGGDQQITVMAAAAGQGDLFQEAFLEGFQSQFDRAKDDGGSGVDAAGTSSLYLEFSAIEGDEVCALPIAFEDCIKFGEDVRVARRGCSDVPFQAGDLRGVGEVGGADVGGGEAAAALEDPGFSVQPGGAHVIRDADVGAEVGELLQGGLLSGSGVDRRQDPQRLATLAVPAQRGHQRVDTAAADEGHQDVDLVSGVDLGVELVQQSRFAGCIGEQGGVQQWDERLRDRLRSAIRTALEDRVQNRAGLHRRLGEFGLDDLGQPGDEISGHLDADPNPVVVADGLQGALDATAEVQGDAVSGLGGV